MPYMIAVSLEMSDEPYLKIKYYLCNFNLLECII